ncbi:type II secretion system major pseudopilin GspG [Pseudomonas quasicaspiana]|uniref:type II secretion system major pseudopilin GspG n=1 Tax=Pseudomonas quasicaspiana TaxID=2829821 RepID=UPI000F00CB68|nr:type II secretion system major pseudopilin GspG [Pseudomonas quasicaspiana]MCD5980616.1 type II secretion system major pseudopilin GspG [Pseudomonas quasicaspiana]
MSFSLKRFKPGRRQNGFTLLEMLAVIVLLGIVATIVVRQVGGNVDKGKYGAGKAQLASLSMKIESYALDVGSPPKTLQQLVEKSGNASGWAGPYAKPSDLKDPFGHAFGYRFPGQHGTFDLIFFGQDGQAGGEGYSADLGNWE